MSLKISHKHKCVRCRRKWDCNKVILSTSRTSNSCASEKESVCKLCWQKITDEIPASAIREPNPDYDVEESYD